MDKLCVIMSGLPGGMAVEAAREIEMQPDIELARYALSSRRGVFESGRYPIELVAPENHGGALADAKRQYDRLIAVDFSKAPMERNGSSYVANQVPFVYGGTIGDRDALAKIVNSGNVSAFVAPNFSRALNILTGSYFGYISEKFPGSMKGFKGEITESHQSTKPDISGTARAWKSALERLGVEMDDIEPMRDEAHCHAYHWVDIAGDAVNFSLSIKVLGRKTYAKEVPGIVRFLDRKVREGSRGEMFSMADYMASDIPS